MAERFRDVGGTPGGLGSFLRGFVMACVGAYLLSHQVAVVGPDDTVEVRTVKADARVGSLWIVAEGLKPGDRVVVEGADRLRSGLKVRSEASAASPAAPSR